MYVPSQWEMALLCDVVSHWLGTYTEWSQYPSSWASYGYWLREYFEKIDHVITELHCISQISLVLRCTFWDLDPVHDSAVSLQLSSTSSSWPWSPRSSWGHHGRSHRSAARGPGRLSMEVCWRVGSAGSRSRGQCHTLSTRLWNMAPAGNNSNVKSIGEE